jgi:hypothetical protein
MSSTDSAIAAAAIVVDFATGSHKYRAKMKQALVTAFVRDAFADNEYKQKPRAASEFLARDRARRCQAAEVAGADILEHRVHERMAESLSTQRIRDWMGQSHDVGELYSN